MASKLCLLVRQTEEEAQESVNQAKQAKLVFDGGVTHLPRPESLRDGCRDRPVSLPDTNRSLIESYIKAGNRRIGLLKTEGRRTLSLGKSLYMSKHVHDLQYHGINANISYCFVRGKVTPQQKLSLRPYNCWVVINKETGQFLSAECSCIVG
ncbi:hypothetical protein HOLleu_19383 [Holothuria leucospilota]|uniref:Uncharacterized protein n=1 Tax=Holothuria leucospilota TaxID=206669 RepID=A0A9Q1BZ97_HOLLE|nr:hypothetical protein HOLleu_19383 [Holothuria leucospilota]